MEAREVNRLIFDFGYLGPSLNCAGVCDLLPYLTIGNWANGSGHLSAGWLFWYASIEWNAR